MTYFPNNTVIYWTESGVGQVRSSGTYGGAVSNIITSGLEHPYGIAIDAQDDRLYYGDYGTNTIKRTNIDGTNETTIASGLGDPRGIAVDTDNNKLYWCDSLSGVITQSDLDGSNDTTIVSGTDVFGIALDSVNSKIYWTVTSASGSIMRADLDGSNAEYVQADLSLGNVLTSYDSQTFADSGTYSPKAIKMSGTKHVVIYTHALAGNHPAIVSGVNVYGKVIEYSGVIATSGDEFLLKTDAYPDYNKSMTIHRINDTQFFIAYAISPPPVGAPYDTDIDIISISGELSLKVDSTTQLDAEFMQELYSTEAISQAPGISGVYIITGKSLSDKYAYLRAVAISGTTVSLGNRISIEDTPLTNTRHLSVAGFNDSEFIVFYAPTGIDKTRYRYGSLSGLTINSFGSSGVVGTDKLMESPVCKRLSTDRVVMFGEISDDDNRIYIYDLIDGNISGTPLGGIAIKHSDRHSFDVIDGSTVAYCTYTYPTASINVCNLTDVSGTIGIAVDKTITINGSHWFPLWITDIDSDSFALYAAHDASGIGEIHTFTINSQWNVDTSGSLSYPRPLTIDAEQGDLYWANYYDDDGGKVEICHLDLIDDSSGIIIPQNSGYKNVLGLDIDHQNQKIYIADDSLGTISRANVDGSDIETVIDNLSNPVGLVTDYQIPTTYISLYINNTANSASGSDLYIKGHQSITSLDESEFYMDFGDEAEFLSSGNAYFNSVSALDASKFVVGYCDLGDSYNGTAKVGTVSGTTITFGEETEFLSPHGTGNLYTSTAALDDSMFVVAYTDNFGPANNGAARIGTVSGTTITFGDEAEFLPSHYAPHISTAALSSSKFVIVYKEESDLGDTTNHGYATIGSVISNDITFGTRTEFCTFCAQTSVVKLTSSKFIVAYRDTDPPGDPNKGYVKVGTIDDDSITFGSGFKFLIPGGVDYISTAALTDSKFVIVYRDTVDNNHGTAKIGTVVGDVVTFGDEVEFVSIDGNQWNSVVALDDSTFAIAYADTSDNSHGTIKIGTVNGTTITFDNETEFTTPSGAAYISVAKLNASKVVITYCDLGDNLYGKAKIGTLGGTTYSPDLFIAGPQQITASGSLFISGPQPIISSGNLFIAGPQPVINSGNLFVGGKENITTSGDLYVCGCVTVFTNTDLFIEVPEPGMSSINLFMRGTVIVPPLSGIQPLDWLVKTPDYYPQIVGIFETSASGVNIQIWDITNGQNTLMSISSSGCYAISDTGRWGWSTTYLPTTQEYAKHYFYLMTSDVGETFGGQFILDTPEEAKWIHPGDMDDYVLRI